MYSIQVDETLQQIINIFYQIGIWQSDEESNFRKIGKRLFYTFYSALFPFFFATNAFLCADRSESYFSLQATVLTMVLYVKYLYLLFKKQEILAFLFDQIVVHSIENRGEYEHAKRKIKKFIRFVRPYCAAFFVTAILLVVLKLPIFSVVKGLPVFISFSWNDSEIIYWLAFLFVSLSTLLYVIINCITPLIWYMMLNYSIEYELLGNKLRRLTSLKLTQRSMFVEDLIVLIKAYHNLNDTTERFRSCFATLFLGQISTSGVGICVSVYNLAFASNQNIFQTQLHAIVLIYGLFDIFLVMYLANEITVASDGLSYCLFESNWIEQTESCKKYVLIMGEMLRRTQRLVILIYPLNLETFMNIIEGAFSMFNLLKSFQ